MELDKINSISKETIQLYSFQAKQKNLLANSAAGKSLTAKEDKQLRKACQDFESFFTYYLLKQMRSTVPQDEVLGESMASGFYRDMFDEAVAAKLSKSRGTGLSSMLYENVKKSLLQEKNPPPTKVSNDR